MRLHDPRKPAAPLQPAPPRMPRCRISMPCGRTKHHRRVRALRRQRVQGERDLNLPDERPQRSTSAGSARKRQMAASTATVCTRHQTIRGSTATVPIGRSPAPPWPPLLFFTSAEHAACCRESGRCPVMLCKPDRHVPFCSARPPRGGAGQRDVRHAGHADCPSGTQQPSQ
jgi:hypothetical protein